MAGMSNSSDEDMITGINVTPLVDVVLVLLVIFMITAPAIYQSAIKVELPKAVSGEKTEHITLRFTLMKDGKIVLGKDETTLEKIPELVKSAIEKDPTANAVLFADAGVSHGQVMKVLDQIKANGIAKFALGVDSPESKGGK